MDAQQQTLQQYRDLMRLNASSHVLRAAREVGLLDELAAGQRTLPQLIEACQLHRPVAQRLVDCLVSMDVLQQYRDDYALAPVAQLLCQYDRDLGDSIWQQLDQRLQAGEGEPPGGDTRAFHDHTAATQWIHTADAMQAAEMLQIGTARKDLRILDLGCGSGVWSAAIAYRDPGARVTAVDRAEPLVAATTTAQSIDLADRWEAYQADPLSGSLPAGPFDLVVLAGRIRAEADSAVQLLIDRARTALAAGGELLIVDLFDSGGRPTLSEALEALRVELQTPAGRVRTAMEVEGWLLERGFEDCQFSYLNAGPLNLGALLARRSDSPAAD